MKMCENCGGDCIEIEISGQKKYKCLNCDTIFDIKVEKPKIQSTSTLINPAKPKYIDHGENILNGEEIFEKMQDCAVEIFVQNKTSAARASGFFVSQTGFVITNAHAVLDEHHKIYPEIYIKVLDKFYRAVPVAVGLPANGINDTLDLALLVIIDMKNSNFATFGNSQYNKNGQKVYLIGNSLGEGTCITSGIISDSKRKMSGLSYPYIMTDAAANHGNSGGPLLNEKGEVIGVLVAGIDSAKGMNYAIPSNIVKDFLSFVTKKTKLNSSVLGSISNLAYYPSEIGVSTNDWHNHITLILDVIQFINNR